jgi:adenylate cyclase
MAEHGAIVFTDIVGFTALTDAHGDDVALALLERQERMVRAALPDAARVVKELGDGLLLWFDDPREAIDTCLRLQREFDAVNDAADAANNGDGDRAIGARAGDIGRIGHVDEVPLWVRMGVHWGCPRKRGDDIVGRDVNLAARIVDLAGPGEVLCSEATADVIGARPGVGFEPLGPVFVRGISEPVPIVRVLTAIDIDCAPDDRARGTSSL